MLEPSLSKLMEHIDTRYLLVNVAADRARAISYEADERGEPLQEKPVRLAIQEIAEGRLRARIRQDAPK